MGTRSLTIFTKELDNADSEICVLYRQMDGYPSGHGRDLKDALSNAKIGNGIPAGVQGKFFNGMSDLVTQTITRLKVAQTESTREWKQRMADNDVPGFRAGPGSVPDVEAGGFYLHKPGTRDCWEEYVYTVYPRNNTVCVRVEGHHGELYNGPVDDFDIQAAERADSDDEDEYEEV